MKYSPSLEAPTYPIAGRTLIKFFFSKGGGGGGVCVCIGGVAFPLERRKGVVEEQQLCGSICLCLESWWALRGTRRGEWRHFSADLPRDKSGSLTNRPQLGLAILFSFRWSSSAAVTEHE